VVEDALDQTGADPSWIWLEITESTLMTDTRMAQQVLGELRELGLHITVDDFGTGYSSLTYLQRFPVEGLKVDRSFVSGIGADDQADAICQALVSLGAALDLHVVAEGVEDESQLAALQRLDCPFAQGYLFGRPQSADSIQARLDVAAATPAPVR
jgi:EAL domain-containing protein (putative c-di-GMP-specific phosphodiesterase class I)